VKSREARRREAMNLIVWEIGAVEAYEVVEE
jgi:hypothetical protein